MLASRMQEMEPERPTMGQTVAQLGHTVVAKTGGRGKHLHERNLALTLKEWLRHTGFKLAGITRPLLPDDRKRCEEIKLLLTAGCRMFMDNPEAAADREECGYPESVCPSRVPTSDWLLMTRDFLDKGWLSKETECLMARLVIADIEDALALTTEKKLDVEEAGDGKEPKPLMSMSLGGPARRAGGAGGFDYSEDGGYDFGGGYDEGYDDYEHGFPMMMDRGGGGRGMPPGMLGGPMMRGRRSGVPY